jgi:hypothetical protein
MGRKVGCLGDIIFTVSDDAIKTFRDASLSGSVQIAGHKRHLGTTLQEFTGIDPDAFSFSIRLSKYLGTDPHVEINKIINYERTGYTLPLIVGESRIGSYRWLIEKHKIVLEGHDKSGNLVTADVTISLTEYVKE